MTPFLRRTMSALLVVMFATVAACSDRDNMRQGARLKPFEGDPKRPRLLATDMPPSGTIPVDAAGESVAAPPRTLALLQRGRQRFDVYCAPCHARDGYGDGIIARHGFPPPPSLHAPDIVQLPDDHYARVIDLGLGKMPPYGQMVSAHDRDAIVAYIRALQLSQHAPPDAVPPGVTPLGQSMPEVGS